MTSKTKPWKPYDVEQAKAAVQDEAMQAKDVACERIERAVDASIKKLETEAATFKNLPPDSASLFTEAEHVMIEELDLRQFAKNLPTPIRLRCLEMVTNYQGIRIGVFREPGVELPSKKFRVLTFFFPTEE